MLSAVRMKGLCCRSLWSRWGSLAQMQTIERKAACYNPTIQRERDGVYQEAL